MAKLEIILPSMGEGITEATITKLLKNIGDKVESEESVIEVATDKVDSEIPAPENGVLEKFLFNEGDVVQVGEVIAIINTLETSDPVEEDEKRKQMIIVEEISEASNPGKVVIESEKSVLYSRKTHRGSFISPLVRKIAFSEGILIEELDDISGSGINSKITKSDLLNYIGHKGKPQKSMVNGSKKPNLHQENGSVFELIEMDRMRKLIARHMIESKKISAHVTSFIEVDMTRIVNWRNKVKTDFQAKYDERLTFTPIFVEAAVKALQAFPMVNISIEGDHIIKKKYLNIGMATALPSGNLIVPVIKNAGEQNLLGLTKSVNNLARRARENKLKPDEIQGGTFTITNLGQFGNITGTPIINQPEVAILAVGAIKKKPAVIETPEGDTLGIRHIMVLSMSYDHRVVDGALGGMFIKFIADILENFDTTRNI